MNKLEKELKERLKDSKYIKYYNCNPFKLNTGDCVYRALSLFFDISWRDVAKMEGDFYLKTGETFQTMSELNLSSGLYLYSALGIYLETDLGCTRFFDSRINLREKIIKNETVDYDFKTLSEFIDKYARDNEKYLFLCSSHITVVKNKKIWDTDDYSEMMPTFGYVRS